MPKWARLSTTSDASLNDRMASVFEDGRGDEGPMAKGCCFVLLIFPLLFVVGSIVWFLMWLGSVLM